LGDHKPCCEGIWELCIDVGPGYRVYYARVNTKVMLLFLEEIKAPAIEAVKFFIYLSGITNGLVWPINAFWDLAAIPGFFQ
jgi:hypothetical protein